jgi:hypothetical protein
MKKELPLHTARGKSGTFSFDEQTVMFGGCLLRKLLIAELLQARKKTSTTKEDWNHMLDLAETHANGTLVIFLAFEPQWLRVTNSDDADSTCG